MKHTWIMLFLISVLIIPSSAQSSQIDIYVTSVSFHEGEEAGVFVITSNVSIVNNNADKVKFIHSDLCEFKINITSLPDGAVNYYPFPCLEATKMVEFEPGITKTNASGGLKLINSTASIIPNGNYSITVLLNEYQLDSIHQVYGGSFVIINGSIVSSDFIVDPLVHPIETQSLYFPVSYVLVVFVLFYQKRIKK